MASRVSDKCRIVKVAISVLLIAVGMPSKANEKCTLAGNWQLVEAEIVAGRSVAWTDDHAYFPLAVSGRKSDSPLSTESGRIVIQNTVGGYHIQGGQIAELDSQKCMIELHAFIVEPFEPDPTKPTPNIVQGARFYTVASNLVGGRAIIGTVDIPTRAPALLRASAAIDQLGGGFHITRGSTNKIMIIRLPAEPCLKF